MTKILGKADLLERDNLKRELVSVPELGGSIWMREMSGAHVIEFKRVVDQYKAEGVKETNFEQDVELMTMVISFSACDEDGALLFTQEEARQLTRNNINVLMDLGNKAMALSGIVIGGNGLTSEVADNLPNDPAKSLPPNSPKSSRKRGRKS